MILIMRWFFFPTKRLHSAQNSCHVPAWIWKFGSAHQNHDELGKTQRSIMYIDPLIVAAAAPVCASHGFTISKCDEQWIVWLWKM